MIIEVPRMENVRNRDSESSRKNRHILPLTQELLPTYVGYTPGDVGGSWLPLLIPIQG